MSRCSNGLDIEDLKFDHSEADTILISAYAKLRDTGNRSPIVLDAAGTDVDCIGGIVINSGVLVIEVLLYWMHQALMFIVMWHRHKLHINIQKFLSEEG